MYKETGIDPFRVTAMPSNVPCVDNVVRGFNISDNALAIKNALCEVHNITEAILIKLQGASDITNKARQEKDITCLNDLLECSKVKAEDTYNLLDRINSLL